MCRPSMLSFICPSRGLLDILLLCLCTICSYPSPTCSPTIRSFSRRTTRLFILIFDQEARFPLEIQRSIDPADPSLFSQPEKITRPLIRPRDTQPSVPFARHSEEADRTPNRTDQYTRREEGRDRNGETKRNSPGGSTSSSSSTYSSSTSPSAS